MRLGFRLELDEDSHPIIKIIQKIAKALGVSVDDLLKK